ncbi:MAG: IPT/TIG domain-containing protein, partial [Actinobacteria bacterium]|nr:IPT/TIG domain-containing protein [Actinomycetota bacterium]
MRSSSRAALAAMVLVGIASAASAQGPVERTYEYDVMGNRTAATNLARFTSAAAFSIDPHQAQPGDPINIYGRNFPVGQDDEYAVLFGGTEASGTAIVRISSRVITVTVPAGIEDGVLTVRLPDGSELDVGEYVLQGLSIEPTEVALDYGEALQFTGTVYGAKDRDIEWAVAGVPGGNATVGTITTGGLYTAPAGGTSATFPIQISARNERLDLTAVAAVTLACSSSGTISAGVTESGSLVPGFERDCYLFDGSAGTEIYVAYSSAASAWRLRVRRANGQLLGETGPGAALALPSLLLPATEEYRIEVESAASGSGDYDVVFFENVERGRWLFPGDGFWHDPKNWSRGIVPEADDAVTIGDFANPLTVTVSQGTQTSASVECAETLKLTGGTLAISGQLDVTGALMVAGGTLANATVSSASVVEVTTSSSWFDAVTLESDVDVLGTLNVRNGLTLADATLTVKGTTSGYAYLYFNDTGGQSVNGSGEIVLAAPLYYAYVYIWPGTVIVEAGITIRKTGSAYAYVFSLGALAALVNEGSIICEDGFLYLQASTGGWTNSGTIEALGDGEIIFTGTWTNSGAIETVEGGEITLPGTFTNSGSVTIGGAKGLLDLTLGDSWASTGTITVTDATVLLRGSFTLADLETLETEGATLRIYGTLVNEGTFDVGGDPTRTWELETGTIQGGTITNDTTWEVDSGWLDGVTLACDVDIVGSLNVRNGLTLSDATLTVKATPTSYAYLYFNDPDGQTLGGTGELVLEAPSYYAYVYLYGGDFTLEAGVSLRKTGEWYGYFYALAATSAFVNEST